MFHSIETDHHQKQALLLQAITIRKTIPILNHQLQKFILLQESALLSQFHSNYKQKVNKNQEQKVNYLIQQAYRSMTVSEKYCYYLKTIYFLNQWEQMRLYSKQQLPKDSHETKNVKIKINYKSFQSGTCTFNPITLTFKHYNQSFQNIQIKLQDYFVRHSKNRFKNTLALMPIRQTSKSLMFRLAFSQEKGKNQFLCCYQKTYKAYIYEQIRQGYLKAKHAEIRLKLNHIQPESKQNNQQQQFEQFFLSRSPRGIQSQIKRKMKKSIQFQSFMYIIDPLPSTNLKKTYKPEESHQILVKSDWILQKNGQLIYINQQKLDVQRGVIKHLFAKAFKNISEGKSIFSVCLPVALFGNQSLTQRICQCLGYAPIALQNVKSYKDKLRGTIIMAVGFYLLYIEKMDKTFNSVIGETYQGTIDGCPVSSEQISHHPPITSFYLKGRGYTVYGTEHPIVQFGLNKIHGSNLGIVSISFHETDYTKNVIKFSIQPTEISGLIFGGRGVKRVDSSYIYDDQNQVFCRLYWGSYPKGKNPNSKLQNFMHGQIVRLNTKIQDVDKNYKKVDGKLIQQVLWQIQGNWTNKVFMDKQLIFDFAQQTPFECVQSQAILPSHSNLRKDIIQKRAGNMQQSQIQKQRIQTSQRNDRKLRQNKL